MKIKSCQLLLVFSVVLSIVFVALPGFAQSGALQVKCVDASGNPVPNVKVVVFNIVNQKDKDKKSDAQGIAEFTKLDEGVYRAYGRKDGFTAALFEPILVKGAKESVTLKLASGPDKKFYFEDPAEAQKAMELMKQAFEAYKQNKFADAEKLFEQVLDINPSQGEALYYSAVSCLQQGKFDQSTEILNRTIKVTEALKNLPSPVASGPNPYDQIYQGAQQVLKKLPAIKGEYALNQKQYDVAAAEFSEAVKAGPDNFENYYYLAVALTNAKKFDEAMAAIDKAIQLKPGDKNLTDVKANISARKENAGIDKAQAIMNEGNKLLQDGDAAGALKKFEEARGMVPQDKQSPLWRQIARADAKLNQPDAAVAAFNKAIELAPAETVADFRNSLALYYVDAKDYDKAIDVLTDPKALGSGNVEQVLLTLASSSKNKQPQLAEAALERVIKANPGKADTYFELGEMYYADGKEKDSRTKELLTKYVEMGKDAGKVENAKNMLIMVARRNK